LATIEREPLVNDDLPLVSIVTPSLNQGRFIAATIESVKTQDYPHIEHIVADGGSTDETLEILARYSHLIWVSEPDQGQCDAINKGFRMARGEIVAWLNSDDIYQPGAVAEAAGILADHPEAALVYANYLRIDEEGRELRRFKARPFNFRYMLDSGNQIPQPTVFMRASVLREVGFLNQAYQYTMDFDLWIRIGRKFPLLYVDRYWSATREHPETKTSREPARLLQEEREIARAHGAKVFSERLFRHWAHKFPWIWSLWTFSRRVRKALGRALSVRAGAT
jgi:glycosyltransferase involved in cell wall biosynthesis